MAPGARTRLALAAFCVVTLGLKVGSIQAAVPMTDEQGTRRLSAFLAHEGFAPVEAPEMVGLGMASGRRDGCRLVLAAMSLQGYQDDILNRVRAEGDAVAYVLDGEVHAASPKWRARLGYYGDKLRRGMGLPVSGSTLTGVVASPACRIEALDWRSLGTG